MSLHEIVILYSVMCVQVLGPLYIQQNIDYNLVIHCQKNAVEFILESLKYTVRKILSTLI